MKTKHVPVSKSMQRRVAVQGESRDPRAKNPRVPIFPPNVVPVINRLNEIIDAGIVGERGDKFHFAYGLLTRLSVLWATHPDGWPNIQAEYDVETGMVYFESELVRDTLELAMALSEDLIAVVPTLSEAKAPDVVP